MRNARDFPLIDVTKQEFERRLNDMPRGIINQYGILLNIIQQVVIEPKKVDAVEHITKKVVLLIRRQSNHRRKNAPLTFHAILELSKVMRFG